MPKAKLEREYKPDVIPKVYADFIRKDSEKKNLHADNIKKLAISEKYTVQSKIREIIKELIRKPKFVFNKLFNTKKKEKAEVVTAFLSLLELSKMSRIKVTQVEMIWSIFKLKLIKYKNK